MLNHGTDLTAAEAGRRVDPSHLNQGTPRHRTWRGGGWPGRLLPGTTAVIDLGCEPADHGGRTAWVAGLSALVFGAMTGAKVRLVEWHTIALTDSVRTRALVVHALSALVLTPLFVGVFLALPELATRLLRRLREDEVIRPPDAGGRLDEFAKDLERRLNRVRTLMVAPTLLYLVYLLVDEVAKPRSWRKVLLAETFAALKPSSWREVLLVVAAVAQAGIFYVAVTALMRLWSTSQAIGKLLWDFPIHVQPLHPDGCGGLWIVGHLLSLVLYVAALLGAAGVCIFLALQGTPWVPTRRPEPYVLAGFYAFLLPSAFVRLLRRPHELMDKRRDEVLKPVARTFDAAILATKPRRTDGAERLRAKGDKLQELSRQLKLLDDACPVWPLRLRRLRPVVATAVLPVAIPVVTAVISKLLTG